MPFKTSRKTTLDKARFLIFLALYFVSFDSVAQKEASVWLNSSGTQFNFQSENLKNISFEGDYTANASICDQDGNLMLYSNGQTIWNRNHEIVKYGENLISGEAFVTGAPVFVPYPGKIGWYILFYQEDFYQTIDGIYSNSLYFAEIDANANSGKGEVIRKKVKIHDNFHSSPAIAGYCGNSYFWLVIDRNDNVLNYLTDQIYFYKIDSNGVNLEPIINEPPSISEPQIIRDPLRIGNSNLYKFSPNGDKLSFLSAGDGSAPDRDLICEFNFETGKLYNARIVAENNYSQKEFSPDSKLLYFFSKGNLIQMDVVSTSTKVIWNSADTILSLSTNNENVYQGGDLQLAPNGKLYFLYFDFALGKSKLGVINEPNQKGFACIPETDVSVITSNISRFPEFVTSFFRNKNAEEMNEVFPKAGPNWDLCSNESAIIGVDEGKKAYYQWIPEEGINDMFSPQTSYFPVNHPLVSPQKSTLVLRATDGNCWVHFDTVQINTLPVPPKLLVDGSWSVCPFVEEVEYWTVADKNQLHWLVDGGEIVSDPKNDTIKINWGDSNMNASVSLYTTNKFGCNSDTTVFPVRINVILITETPKGDNQLCIAQNKNIPYQIRRTNGSVYNWFAEAGEIVQGQGTNKVFVDWKGEGQHQLFVEETSTTIDTICFGESLPLLVNIRNDSLEADLNLISYDSENQIEIQYFSQRFQENIHSLFINFQDESGKTIEESRILNQDDGKFSYPPSFLPSDTEIIRLKIINSCNETFYSNPQQTIFLSGIERKYENSIHLDWNINQFWKNDKLEHEIWYSTNGQNDWERLASGENETEFEFPLKGLSLTYFFRIKEINRDQNLESWSNRIAIQIVGDLMIPDIFTPNGDGKNDEWLINNIRFHPFQKIEIYDKFGQIVYQCNQEFIPWDGRINGKILQGTYFYRIDFESEGIKYGQVTILK